MGESKVRTEISGIHALYAISPVSSSSGQPSTAKALVLKISTYGFPPK